MNVKLKKLNAVLGLLTVVLLFAHAGFTAYCYITMFYDPVLKKIFSLPLIIVCCLHAVLGMSLVFIQSEGTDLTLYPGYNKATIAQRLSAALIFPMLIVHLRTFSLLSASAEKGVMAAFFALIIVEILFFGTIFTHVSVSFSRALITLGLLTSRKKQQTIDKAMIVISAVSFVICVISVVRTQLIMFLR